MPACVVVHRIADLNRRWITAVDGIPCTVVARTLVDLGAVARHDPKPSSRRGWLRCCAAYPELKLAIEVDGFEPHTALDVFRNDRARQNDLVASGWTVLRYVWRDVNAMAWHVAWEIERTRRRLAAEAAPVLGSEKTA